MYKNLLVYSLLETLKINPFLKRVVKSTGCRPIPIGPLERGTKDKNSQQVAHEDK